MITLKFEDTFIIGNLKICQDLCFIGRPKKVKLQVHLFHLFFKTLEKCHAEDLKVLQPPLTGSCSLVPQLEMRSLNLPPALTKRVGKQIFFLQTCTLSRINTKHFQLGAAHILLVSTEHCFYKNQ